MAKFLIIDDSTMARSIVRMFLAGLGHEVVGESGEVPQAIQFIKELSPEVVTLDMVLPGGTGFDVLTELKRANPHVKVIVITASGQDIVDRQVMALGAAAILRKPFGKEDFRSVIENVLGPKTK